jgi:response regulator RpfG family c-di-GMP phosphodiesterase
MASTASLEFLLVTSNYQTLNAVTDGLEQLGARFDFSTTAEAARDYLGRRKIDGVFVDLEVPGAQDLILAIRRGMANRHAAIFACLPKHHESAAVVVQGATEVLQQPLTVDGVVSRVSSSLDTMVRERRRYFRHAAHFSAALTVDGTEYRALITNLSEGGMAADLVKPLERLGLVDFAVQLPGGNALAGKGSVAWASESGRAEIMFHFFRGQGEKTLRAWLQEREPGTSQRSAAASQQSNDKN